MKTIYRFIIVLSFSLLIPMLAFAEGAQDKADLAVANILFDYDTPAEFASYRVNDTGFVEIVFASNMPDSVYAELLDKLNKHPDIADVLAGRGGPICSLW
jgi:hypothetical protein